MIILLFLYGYCEKVIKVFQCILLNLWSYVLQRIKFLFDKQLIGLFEVIVIEVIGKVEVERMRQKVVVYKMYGDVVMIVLVLEVLFKV